MKNIIDWMKRNFRGFFTGILIAVFTVWLAIQISGQIPWFVVSLMFFLSNSTISSIGFIGTFIAAIAALFAAWEAKKTAEATLKTAEETRYSYLWELFIQIPDAFRSEEIEKSIKDLKYWNETHGQNLPRIFVEKRSDPSFESLEKYTMKYILLFYKIYLLLDAGIIDEGFVKIVVPRECIEILLNIVEPLQKVIDPNYNKLMFDAFRKIYEYS